MTVMNKRGGTIMKMKKFAGQALEMEVLELIAGGDDRAFMQALLNRKDPVDWFGVDWLYSAAGIKMKRTPSIWADKTNYEFRKNGKVISHLDARIYMARYVGKPTFDVTKYDF
jgi:hypothetical protein